MTRTREIARNEWKSFTDDLSRKEQDHPVHIEVVGREVGDEELNNPMALVGLSLEEKGSEEDAIDIMLGRPSGDSTLTHRVPHATRMLTLEKDDGVLECLDIEDADTGRTLVFFD